jgi:starch synthase
MAEKKRILVVTQEFTPFTETLSEIAEITHNYAQFMQDNGMEVRILMPRYGSINERRHRLHEVVRLSGMNITVDDEDYPLIIKVASLPGTRMQIYFLDSEEFFKRKKMYTDNDDKPFEDNMDRMVFFCKGVIETVKKFGWAPDIVHCHGWMTSLIPAYLKNHYKNEPIFQNARFVYSVYQDNDGVSPQLEPQFTEKTCSNQLTEDSIKEYITANGIDLHRGATFYSDAVVLDKSKVEWSHDDIPVLDSKMSREDKDWAKFVDFFNGLFVQSEQCV